MLICCRYDLHKKRLKSIEWIGEIWFQIMAIAGEMIVLITYAIEEIQSHIYIYICIGVHEINDKPQ